MTESIVLFQAKQIVGAKRDALFGEPIVVSPARAAASYRSTDRATRAAEAHRATRRDLIIGWTLFAICCTAVGAFLGLAAIGMRDLIQAIGGGS